MSSDSFRDLVEKLSVLSENEDSDSYTCPLCDENPCVCDEDKLHPKHEETEEKVEETISAQRLAQSFANEKELPYAIRVFSKLKAGEAEALNNDDRLEAARILKMLIPAISEDDLFARINNDMVARAKNANIANNTSTGGQESEKQAPEVATNQQTPPVNQ